MSWLSSWGSTPVEDRKGCCSAKAVEAGTTRVTLAAAAHAISADMNLSLTLGWQSLLSWVAAQDTLSVACSTVKDFVKFAASLWNWRDALANNLAPACWMSRHNGDTIDELVRQLSLEHGRLASVYWLGAALQACRHSCYITVRQKSWRSTPWWSCRPSKQQDTCSATLTAGESSAQAAIQINAAGCFVRCASFRYSDILHSPGNVGPLQAWSCKQRCLDKSRRRIDESTGTVVHSTITPFHHLTVHSGNCSMVTVP